MSLFSKNGFIFGLAIAVLGIFFLFQISLADTESENATINATVPSICGNSVVEAGEQCDDGNTDNGDGCSSTCQDEGGGGPSDGWPPNIFNIVEDVSTSTAHISWNATDSSGIRSCTFSYGLDISYSGSATVENSYEVFLVDLNPETTYYYRIRCTDNNFNTATETGSFITDPELDDESPVIFNVVITEDAVGAMITWEATDNVSVESCSLVYDDDEALEPYDSSALVDELGGNSYSSDLSGLTPSTDYFIKITCVDAIPNSASHLDAFTTLADVVPPADVSNFVATPGNTEVFLSWDYTDSLSDFSHYIIRRDLSEPTDIDDGDLVASIANIDTHNFTDTGLTNLTEYFYKIFVVDTSDNNSNGVWDSATPRFDNESGLCSDGIDNDLDGTLDCADTDCTNDQACVPGMIEICTNLEDDDNDGLVDCDDPDCFGLPHCGVQPGPEICSDGVDNDEDGLVDCDDPDCNCQEPIEVAECSDGVDNDNDGFVDLADPGCDNEEDDDEYNAPIPTIGEDERITLDDLEVLLAERTIRADFIDRTIHSLPGDQLTISIHEDSLAERNLEALRFNLAGTNYNFVLNNIDDRYYVDVLVPPVGLYNATIEVRYEFQVFDVLEFNVRSLPFGVVKDNESGGFLSGAEVTLISVDDGEELWPGSLYRQDNPQSTGVSGAYGFVVPNGTYKIKASGVNHRDYESVLLTVNNNVVNLDFNLIFVPPKLEDVIDPDSPLAENLSNIFENLSQKAGSQLAVLQEFSDDKQVEEVTKKVVAPAVLSASLVSLLPSLWSILLPLLRFLFLQPILIFGRRKRQSWGVVYNSFSRLPIDLAVVRLLDANTKKVVRSRVTDGEGRYLFIAEPGEYIIQVIKQGFVFPSNILKDVKTDRDKVDIYHGEKLSVTGEKVSLTPNIPIDPVGETKTPARIKWEKRFRVFQHVISISGIIATLISLFISPTWYLWLFLGVHIVLYIMFFVYIKPKKPKGWGIVYEKDNKKPLSKVIVRLFTKDYNKLVSSQITDNKGRYSFLVGANDYYITVEKPGYKKVRTQDISLKDKKGLIGTDFTLERV